jgi:drug/metabolite transporter (DMT)-like permease
MMPVQEQTKPSVTYLQWLLLAVLSLIWGSSFILIKKGLAVYSPMQLGTLRIFTAFLFLLPFAFMYIRRVKPHHWKHLALAGLVGSLFPAILFSIAGSKMDSALSGALNALTPLFTLLIGAFFFRSKISGYKLLGLMLGLIGSIGLIMVRNDGSMGFDFNFYALLVIAATLCYGLNINLIKTYLSDVKPLIISTLSLLTVGPVAGVYLFSTDFVHKLNHVEGSGLALTYVLILGVAGTAIALILFNKLIQLSSPVFASSTTYLIPIVALMWGVLDDEKVMVAHVFGMAAIIGGVLIVNRAK